MSRVQSRLPDFIIIGAMKSGTTSLHSYLGQHTSIEVSRDKELQYFLPTHFEQRGVDWYRNQLASAAPLVGEASPQYAQVHMFPEVPRNIAATVPNAKLIYIVRNPLDRLVSHYVQKVARNRLSQSLTEALTEGPLSQHYVLTGMYGYQLGAFLQHFDRSQIHVMSLERLHRQRIEELGKVFRFLGVDAVSDPELFDFVKNDRQTKRAELPVVQALRDQPLGKLVRALLPESARTTLRNTKAYQRMTTRKVVSPRLPDGLAASLREKYEEDSRIFEGLVGEKFPELFAPTRAPEPPRASEGRQG